MRRMPRIVRAFECIWQSADGSEILEAALVLPLVFMLLLGIVWFGRVFNIYSTMQQAAQQGAITAARAQCATCPPATGWNGTSFAGDTTVENAVFSVMRASSIDTSQVIAFSPAAPQPCTLPPTAPVGGCTTTGNNMTICRDVQVDVTQPAQCGTVVSFQYPFRFYLPFTSLNMQSITLTATAQSRMEN
jgi:Flp pilus assembly protein TadG